MQQPRESYGLNQSVAGFYFKAKPWGFLVPTVPTDHYSNSHLQWMTERCLKQNTITMECGLVFQRTNRLQLHADWCLKQILHSSEWRP